VTHIVDLDTVDPNHLEELAHLIRNNRLRQREIAVAHASELLGKPTIGWWRQQQEQT
jgi:hypothetical protein